MARFHAEFPNFIQSLTVGVLWYQNWGTITEVLGGVKYHCLCSPRIHDRLIVVISCI